MNERELLLRVGLRALSDAWLAEAGNPPLDPRSQALAECALQVDTLLLTTRPEADPIATAVDAELDPVRDAAIAYGRRLAGDEAGR